MKRLMIVLSAFALAMALAVSPALAEERVHGPAAGVMSAAPTELTWGGSALNRLVPSGAEVRGPSSNAGSPVRLAPAFGGGSNISSFVELPSGLPSGTVDAVTHPHDVYMFYLEANASIRFFLDPANTSAQIQLRLFSPAATDINVQSPIAVDSTYLYPTDDGFTASVGGYYYVDVYAVSGSSAYTLDYLLYASPNDDIPGVAPTASPIVGWLDSVWDRDDVYQFPLRAGDRLSVSMAAASSASNSSDFDVDLYAFAPPATSVFSGDSFAYSALLAPAVESMSIVATQTGTYRVDAFAYTGFGWGSLAWNVTPTRPAFTRSPSASKLTYKRKKGKAKFTLKAKMLNQFSLPVKSAKVYLQTSSNGRSWKNTYTLYTNSTGWLTKTITAKKKGTKYYRWYRPMSATNTSAQTGAQKVVIK